MEKVTSRLWREAANVMNKESVADKKWSSIFRVESMVTTPQLKDKPVAECYTQSLGLADEEYSC
jgi:hypothetical protein